MIDNVKEYLDRVKPTGICYSRYKAYVENPISAIKFKQVMEYLGYEAIKLYGVYHYRYVEN